MSDTGTVQAPRRFRLDAPFAQVRVANRAPFGPMRGPWTIRGFKQGGVISEDELHPADLEHLLSATFDVYTRIETDAHGAKTLVREKMPMLVELSPEG